MLGRAALPRRLGPARDRPAVRAEPDDIALRVPDVAEARAELEAKGVEFAGETIDTGVCHMAFFHDPTATR